MYVLIHGGAGLRSISLETLAVARLQSFVEGCLERCQSLERLELLWRVDCLDFLTSRHKLGCKLPICSATFVQNLDPNQTNISPAKR